MSDPVRTLNSAFQRPLSEPLLYKRSARGGFQISLESCGALCVWQGKICLNSPRSPFCRVRNSSCIVLA